MGDKMEYLISKYQHCMPKRNWTEVQDIYEMGEDGRLNVWGRNGRFYKFSYYSETDWEIRTYPVDIYGRRVWMGYGRGWEDVE